MDQQASAALVLPLSIFLHLACRYFVRLHGREEGHRMARIYTGHIHRKYSNLNSLCGIREEAFDRSSIVQTYPVPR